MATRKSKRQINRKRPYDHSPSSLSEDPTTWDKEKLVQELKGVGIEVPATLSQKVLLQLFKANSDKTVINSTVAVNNNIEGITTTDSDTRMDTIPILIPGSSAVNDSNETRMNTIPAEQRPASSAANSEGNMSHVLNAFASMTQCFSGLQDTVTQLLKSNQTEKIYDAKNGFTLQKWYSQNTADAFVPQSNIHENLLQNTNNEIGQHGVRSDSFTNIDIVSPSLQRQIIEGKDVNLASLLIPNYECPKSHTVIADNIEVNLPGKPDIRLNRALSIQEFIKAFGKFKRIMSAAYPDRRTELDVYGEDIIDISNFYGQVFYDYHKMFSAKAATLLREHHVKVDWSKRDRDLLAIVAAGVQVNVCKLCHMCDHTTEFCPLQLRNQSNFPSDNRARNNVNDRGQGDKYGRIRIFHDGKEICNNFNNKGCTRNFCSYSHICSKCKSTGHSQLQCGKRPAATTSANQTASGSVDKVASKVSQK